MTRSGKIIATAAEHAARGHYDCHAIAQTGIERHIYSEAWEAKRQEAIIAEAAQ